RLRDPHVALLHFGRYAGPLSGTHHRRRVPAAASEGNQAAMSFALYLQAVLGLAVFVVLALPFSSNVRRINWKLVVVAVALQFAICILLLRVPLISDGLAAVNRAVGALGAAT